MPSLGRILLPVDFSARSPGAARYAHSLAARFDAEVTLLHVLTPPHYEFGALEIGGAMLNELYAGRQKQAREDLAAFERAHLSGVRTRSLLMEGDPARTIVDYAHENHADAIVLPTHGYGPFRRFILGSTTAKVLHDADCPVWTGVHLEEAPEWEAIGCRRVLCAIDLGPQSGRALAWAAFLQASFGAKLTVVHATQALPSGETPDFSGIRLQIEEEIRKLERAEGVDAEIAVEAGDPPHAIAQLAERTAADAVVIGRGSAAGAFGRLRTNAYAIIRQSPCSVISV